MKRGFGSGLGRPGSDLLSRVLGHSTIGAEGFHGRVRDGIGCWGPRHNHQVSEDQNRLGDFMTVHIRLCGVNAMGVHGLAAARQRVELLRVLMEIKPIERLVPVGFKHYCSSTSGLST